jgi:hypothetical protein
VTIKLYDNGYGCVIISPTILNRVIQRYRMTIFYAIPTLVLNDFFSMINALFIVLQHVPPV